jgi:membrane-bound serine protease (ClpP class)
MDSAVRSLLIWRIFTSTLEQASLIAVVLWGLPLINVRLPVWVLIPTSIALTIWNVYTYRKASQALRIKPVAGLVDMVGTRGEVVGRLSPSGQVKIRGELWAAETESGEMKPGKKVVVIGQKGLRLTVRETCQDESTGAE